MLAANEAEGWAEAQQRIAACRETRSENLDLSGLRLTRVPEGLTELHWLKELNLQGDRWGRAGIGDEGARALSGLVNLTGLNIASNWIGAKGAKALSGLMNLTELDLRDNQIGDKGAWALSSLVNLTKLILEYTEIGPEGTQALSGLVNLTSLDLSRNQIGAEGARALSGLVKLTWLDLENNEIGDDGARALSGLVNLTGLNLEDNQIRAEGARALSGLVKLTALNLKSSSIGKGNGIGDKGARALSLLVNLESLDLDGNRIGDDGARALSRLVNLTSLSLSANKIGDDGARALASLVSLSWLNLESNRISHEGAQALAGLKNLNFLNLGNMPVLHIGRNSIEFETHIGSNRIGNAGAQALASLINLISLSLRCAGVGAEGARALSSLVNLTKLYLSHNSIGAEGARALASLVNLTSLHLERNGVIDLSSLLPLRKLEELDCSGCRVNNAAPELWDIPSLRKVILYEASLPGVPRELLSQNDRDSCLERLRAHFRDLQGGESKIADFKLMLLGNGRVGKTQICRRLQGEQYDETVPSTHGVKTGAAPLKVPDPVALRIWDFGGQDIYHGTHALFLKSRAIFMLVWTPESEALHDHEYGGFTFRNQPLGYWLDYVRKFGGEDTPIIVVQTQCDLPEQERLRPPVTDEALDAFPFKKLLHYSAKENRGRAALDEALAEAVQWLRRKQGVAVIGRGRAAVKARLEEMYARGKQLMSQDEFLALCEETGNVSSPPLLLDYLHNIGTLFHREGLFGDAIILDQAWALDAVYAVFHRESKAFKNIERYGGRFRRSDLAEWVWQEHGKEEQELFLSFMQQCGICFTYRDGYGDIEAEYIAPDLLPARDDPAIAEQLRQKWDDCCDAEATLTFELLPPGLMRSLISRIGQRAGLAAEYWRDGFYFYDEKTGSRALVEQRYTKDWAGEFHVQTQRGQAQALLQRLLEFIDDRHVAIGARPSGRTIAARETREPAKEAAIAPAPEPSSNKKYYVSYAWGDSTPEGIERERFVDDFCAKAKAGGVEVERDKTSTNYGDRISKFMKEIGKGDRIFIVLSDKYLKSTYCMSELLDAWINCKENEEEFVRRTRVFALDCAKIKTPKERIQYTKYWREKFQELDELIKTEGHDLLALQDLIDHGRMRRFVYETANILQLVQDVLRPQTLDEFVKYSFDDPPPR